MANMETFAPPRTSTPAKSSMASLARARSNSRGLSTSSLPPELQGLTAEEISFIDEVVSRSPPNSAHFLAVFKAYNDILAERGVNPRDEMVYYTKLLKLGTLKGSSWAEKWEWVKSLQGGPSTLKPPALNGVKTQPQTQSRPQEPLRSYPASRDAKPNGYRPSNRTAVFTRLTGTLKSIERDDDAFTLHSHQDDHTDSAETNLLTETSGTSATSNIVPSRRDTPRPNRFAPSPTLTATTSNTLGLHTGPPSSIVKSYNKPPVFPVSKREFATKKTRWKVEEGSVDSTDTVAPPSTVPPSYGAAIRGNDVPRRAPAPYNNRHVSPLNDLKPSSTLSINPTSQSIPGHLTPNAAREAVLRAKERSKNIVNDEDAWEKIRRDQDEKEADRFREEKLIDRCWEVWKQGYQWIRTRDEQVAQARDSHIVRLAVHRWRNLTAQRLELFRRVATLSDTRLLKVIFGVWKSRMLKRKQDQWRADMRHRMKLVREKHELTLLKDAWARWHQEHQAYLAEEHYNVCLVRRCLKRWREKMEELEELNGACDIFVVGKEDALVESCWDLWRRNTEMRRIEKVIAEKVVVRTMANAFDIWKSHMGSHDVADEFYDRILLKRMFGAWKAARDRIRALERRADKHIARQNDILLRAVMRVWGAHERGILLERVKSARLLKQTWTVWQQKLQIQREREETAVMFSQRPSSVLAVSAFQRWQHVLTTHRQASEYAVLYHNSQLQFRYLFRWRLQLRTHLKMARQAKGVETLLGMRRAFRKWTAKLEERRREEKVKLFERKLAKGYFDRWRTKVKQEQELRLIEQLVQYRVSTRIMKNTLTLWINRVSDQKDREIQTTELYEQVLLVTTFRKWAERWTTRVNEKSLLQSFRDIKREEKMRRIFYRWLALARQARHKRLLLEEKEQEFQLNRTAQVWERWKEKVKDRRLQPLADEYILTRATGLVFRAFGVWHAKTKSLPAIHFYNSHLKAKVWKAWKDSVPNPAQSKMAREKHQKALLAKMFKQWSATYKAKMALRAVARARYLGLPVTISRHTIPQPRILPTPVPSVSSSISSYRRPVPVARPETPSASATEEDESDTPVFQTAPLRLSTASGRIGISSLLAARAPRSTISEEIRRPRGPTSVASSRLKLSTRAPSPTGSLSSVATRTSNVAPSQAGSSTTAGAARRSRLLQELEARGLKSRPTQRRLPL